MVVNVKALALDTEQGGRQGCLLTPCFFLNWKETLICNRATWTLADLPHPLLGQMLPCNVFSKHSGLVLVLVGGKGWVLTKNLMEHFNIYLAPDYYLVSFTPHLA